MFRRTFTVFAALTLLTPAAARADSPSDTIPQEEAQHTSLPDTSPCSVERKCSSTGRACLVDDRACQNEAIANGLEVTCERVDPRGWVYCPPGAQQRDSSAVWILLGVAIAVAAIGSILSYVLIRKRIAS